MFFNRSAKDSLLNPSPVPFCQALYPVFFEAHSHGNQEEDQDGQRVMREHGNFPVEVDHRLNFLA